MVKRVLHILREAYKSMKIHTDAFSSSIFEEDLELSKQVSKVLKGQKLAADDSLIEPGFFD